MGNNENSTANPNAWMFFADRSLLAAETLIDKVDLSGEVVFLSQQAVEKYFKAFLAKHKIFIKKTHDLTDLYSEVTKIKDCDLDEGMLQDLKGLYVESRYPCNVGFLEEGSLPTLEEAKSYLDFAKKVAGIIKSELEASNAG
ncbi:MAG: HEPN domain-containing protein [Fibromonadales bacterium]|nr:HEPN domain-containing protein [Fibromonadales bacterium]